MIEAAGGVVLRGGDDDTEVLVVHRRRYDDWSLPKGKLDPGETAADAAVREVEEETGVRVAAGVELASIAYRTPAGLKHVRWFRMQPLDGDPAQRPSDDEVDVAAWFPIDQAMARLTYRHDRNLLARVVGADGHPSGVGDDDTDGSSR